MIVPINSEATLHENTITIKTSLYSVIQWVIWWYFATSHFLLVSADLLGCHSKCIPCKVHTKDSLRGLCLNAKDIQIQNNLLSVTNQLAEKINERRLLSLQWKSVLQPSGVVQTEPEGFEEMSSQSWTMLFWKIENANPSCLISHACTPILNNLTILCQYA